MAEIDLKAYTTRAKELEIAIHTQKTLMSSQETVIQSQAPKVPEKAHIAPPKKPEPPNEFWTDPTFLFLGIFGVIIGGVFPLFMMILGDFQFGIVVLLIIGVLGAFGIRSYMNDKKSNNNLYKVSLDEYQKEMDKYHKLLQDYKKDIILSNENHQNALNEYNANVLKHNQRYNELMDKHDLALSTLEKALKELYDENIIFPKYRNLIAITMINEYLLSGRCDKLEGTDGAYNLYEMELRQNIVIAQLSSIIDNLEQIRSNQFTLYQELQNSNNTINEILSETRKMKETSKLTAYFSGVTALAETSPKYYHGIVM